MRNFIPKPYKKEPITIRISTERVAEIDYLSAQYNLSRSAFISQCIEFALANMPDFKQLNAGKGKEKGE